MINKSQSTTCISRLSFVAIFFVTISVLFLITGNAQQQLVAKNNSVYAYYSQTSQGSIETQDLQMHHQVSGHFFNKDKSVNLDIYTACCDHFLTTHEQNGETFDEWVGPEVIEIKHKNERINLSSHINSSLDGFCVTDTTDQLGILITEGGDAPAAIDQFRYLLLYDVTTEKFERIRYDQVNRWDSETNEIASLRNQKSVQDTDSEGVNKLIDCPINTAPLPATIGAFLPCTCNMTLIEETKSLEELLYSIEGSNDFITNSSYSLYEVDADEPLYYATVSADTVAKIKSYTQSDFVNSFNFKQIKSDKMDMIIFSYWKPIYETHSRILVKTKKSKDWKLIYSAYPNSQGFSPPIFSKIINDRQFEVLMCADGCDWQNGDSSAKIVISNRGNAFFLEIESEIELETYRVEVNKLIKEVHSKVN